MLRPDVPDPREVVRAFALDGGVLDVEAVEGGWSNTVLRLRTTESAYAVKVLRNAWGEPRWRDWLAEGWRLERAARDAGVAMPEPVPAPSGEVAVDLPVAAGSAAVRVHRWLDGSRTVPREPVDAVLARWVGAALARVHRLALRPLDPGLYAGRPGLTRDDVWPVLVARSQDAPWLGALVAAAPVAQRASALLAPWDPATEVLCHGDVDQKNLLLADDGPALCDWDVVLPLPPAHDLVHAAVTMAGWRDAAVARAVIDGYAEELGASPRLRPTDLGPALASRLGWVRFCVDRGLAGDEPGDVDGVLADLEHRVVVAENLPDWLS
ncbi:MAG TPA: phosphotransferase [Candidatus Nanopelagicales bacterium]|nr:phosphotransferase [Candidatus Nanopelagicales bacterium]